MDNIFNLNELIIKALGDSQFREVSEAVGQRKLLLVDLIVKLESILTNEDKSVRSRGVEFLSKLLETLPISFFQEKELTLLLNFYCDRLKDHHSILPGVFKGLLTLSRFENLPEEATFQIITQLTKHVHCQSQLQDDRYMIYQLLKEVTERGTNSLAPVAPDIVYSIISIIEGEIDPKNLLCIFNFLPNFCKSFSLGHLAEELFELLSGYFPVDFNAASKDDIVITRQDLAKALCLCLSSTTEFAEFCIPLILEKVGSTLKTAKLDSYQLLESCCEIYSVEHLETHLTSLWRVINKDVVPPLEPEITEAALNALRSIVVVLAKPEASHETLFSFMEDVVICVKSMLHTVDDQLYNPSMNVLLTLCKASHITTKYTFLQLRPFFNLQFAMIPLQRKILLSSLLPFLPFGQNCKLLQSTVEEEVSSYTDVMHLFVSSAESQDIEVSSVAFKGLEVIVKDLDSSMRQSLYSNVAHHLSDARTRDECLAVFRLLAVHYPDEVMKYIVETHLNVEEKYKDEKELRLMLDKLCYIADLPTFTDNVVPICLQVAFTMFEDVGFQCLLLCCSLPNTNLHKFTQVLFHSYNIPDCVLTWCFHKIAHSNVSKNTVQTIANITTQCLYHLPTPEQQQIIDKFIPLFLDGLSVSKDDVQIRINFIDPSNQQYINAIFILEALIGSIHEEVRVPSAIELVKKLTGLVVNSKDKVISTVASQIVSYIVNKSELTISNGAVEHVCSLVRSELGVEAGSESTQVNSASLLVYVVKALNLRGHSGVAECSSLLFSLLNHQQVGHDVAQGVKIILDDKVLTENKNRYTQIRILYRQRFFQSLSKLIEEYKKATIDSVKDNYLLALINLIEGVPQQLILQDMDQITLVMVKVLETDNTTIIKPALSICQQLLTSRGVAFNNHIQTFLPKFLLLCHFKDCMKTRMAALLCVLLYASYPTTVILPYKAQVLKELLPCLDDKKRMVRAEAVKARGRWFLVGAPGEDSLFSS